jgi:23S rRNA pseudouridine1911/1915/1917 synthase
MNLAAPQGENHTELLISAEDSGQRLDRVLARALPEFSRSRLQALLEQGHITRQPDGKIPNASEKVSAGQRYRVHIPAAKPVEVQAQELPLEIVFEDEHLLVINKAAGMTVHPAPGSPDETLVNALLAHCGETLSGIGGEMRPGIVHRLDKETSGLMVVAKHDAAHQHLSAQLQARTLKRVYRCVAWGVPPRINGSFEGDVGRNPSDRKRMAVVTRGGKPARTHYQVLETFHPPAGRKDSGDTLASYVECQLDTGRTHQIRVHFSHHGQPLIGDPLYGMTPLRRLGHKRMEQFPPALIETLKAFERQALHALRLQFIHPANGEQMTFEAPLSADMEALLGAWRLLPHHIRQAL